MNHPSSFSLSRLLALVAICGSPGIATAVDWTGAIDNDFNKDGNWGAGTAGSAPASGEQARFKDVAVASPVTLSSSTTVGEVRVAGFSVASSATVDTGANTLTIDATNAIQVSGASGAQLTLTGNFDFAPTSGTLSQVRSFSGSSVTFDNAVLSSPSPSTVLGIYSGSAPGTVVFDSATVGAFAQVVAQSNQVVEFNNVTTVDSDIFLRTGGAIAFDSNTDELQLTGDLGGPGGSWVFDLADKNAQSYIVANDIDITNIDLDLTNTPSNATTSNPVILATYNGTLTGTEFANITGLGDRTIIYDFGPLGNQIAIVPEVSWATPILAGFLPMAFLRQRRRRSS